MNKTLCSAALALMMAASPVLAASWAVDPLASTLHFTATATSGPPIQGGFRSFTATIDLDPEKPEGGSIIVNVDMKTASATTHEQNKALPQREWFDVAHFPVALFESRDIRRTEKGYVASGTLTIKGKTLPLSLPFTLTPEGDAMRAEGTVTVARNQFGVGIGEWDSEHWITFPVVVRFSVLARAH